MYWIKGFINFVSTLYDVEYMLMNGRLFLFFLLCAWLAPMSVVAQHPYREIYTSWEDFVEYCADEEVVSQDELERLEQLTQHPLNLNTVSKDALLELPFLTEQQVDSLLAYRERKRRLLTLGELQFLTGWDAPTRRFASLFTYIGDTLRPRVSLLQQFTKGNFVIETRCDFPTYEREGEKRTSGGYLGAGIKNVMRLRYDYGEQVNYGITLEKDAGEPFASQGNNPYDYLSFHFSYTSRDKKHKLLLGDYSLHFGEGLLLGKSTFAGQLGMLRQPSKTLLHLSPHTGTDEYKFFRGVAYSLTHKRLRLTAFASYRTLDAKIENDVASTLYTDGYHRTYTELTHKNTLGNATFGALIEHASPYLHLGISGYLSRYETPIVPLPRTNNRYALSGDIAAGTSLTYASTLHKRLSFTGELASDRRLHLAFSHRFHYKVSDDVRMNVQLRCFSKRFVAPWAETVGFASRVDNERGALVGITWRGAKGIDIESYLDVHQFPFSTYRAEQASHGLKFYLQAAKTLRNQNTTLLRYTYRLWQQNVTGRKDQLEYRGKHRLRLQHSLNRPRLNLTTLIEGSMTHAQTKNAAFGITAALRGKYLCRPNWSVALSGALFCTDDYASAVYAYEPLLPSMYAFGALYYKGIRGAVQTQYTWRNRFTLGIRYGMTHYFNRNTTSSGLQEINSSSKGDINLYLRLKL